MFRKNIAHFSEDFLMIPKLKFLTQNTSSELEKDPKLKIKPLINIEINGPIEFDRSLIQSITPIVPFLWTLAKRSAPWVLSPLVTIWVVLQAIGETALTESLCQQRIYHVVTPVVENVSSQEE